VRAVERAAALLRELGHDVVEEHPVFDADQFSIDFVHMLVGETAADVATAEAAVGRRARPGDLERETAVLARLGGAVSAAEFALAGRRIRALGRAFAPFFARHDLLLTPTLAQPPIAVGSLAAKGAEAAMLALAERLPLATLLHKLGALHKVAANAWSFAPFTAPFNATGQPAVSLPLHWTADNLPVGVQLVGRFGDEATLLRVSAQVERAQPWKDRRPPGF
jgi:amidase